MTRRKDKMVIVVDTREPKPGESGAYTFDGFDDVRVVRNTLDVGDFALGGVDLDGVAYRDMIMIERKTLADLVGSINPKTSNGERREEFERMWMRTKLGQKRVLLIEGLFRHLISGDYRAAFHPNSALGTLFAWQQRYGFDVVWVSGAAEGQVVVYWHLREFLRMHTGG